MVSFGCIDCKLFSNGSRSMRYACFNSIRQYISSYFSNSNEISDRFAYTTKYTEYGSA